MIIIRANSTDYISFKQHHISIIKQNKQMYLFYLILTILHIYILKEYILPIISAAAVIAKIKKSEGYYETFLVFLTYLVFLIFIKCFNILKNYISSIMANKIPYKMYYNLLKKINKISLNETRKYSGNKIESSLKFYKRIHDNNISIINIIQNIITILLILHTLFTKAHTGIILIYILLIVIFMLIVFFRSYYLRKRYDKNVRAQYNEFATSQSNFINNMHNIRLYNAYNHFANKFIKSHIKYANSYIKHNNICNIFAEFINILYEICIFLLTMGMFSSQNKQNKDDDVKKQEDVKKISNSSDLYSIIDAVKEINMSLSQHIQAYEIINQICYLYDSPIKYKSFKQNIENIQITNVNYTINDTKILQNININIEKGDRVLFYGPSGCGKTTLQKLIFGHLVPDNGEIRLNDIPINEIDANDVLLKTSILKQENTIFDDTIYENISVGNVSKEQVQNLCTKANLHVDIDRNAYDALSGGEARRVNTLRMIANYKQNNLIITDESAAGLNRFNMQNMFDLIKSNTSNESILICIEHHIEVISMMNINKIIVFEPIENCGYTTITMTVNEFDEYIRKSIKSNT